MGDVISTHLDESKREMITAKTREVMDKFGSVYGQQYAVALFNSVHFEIEGGGAPQSQLLHRKAPLENKSIFSGSLFHYQEENKKWRNRFLFVANSYKISFYENKLANDRGLHPKGVLSCAGYKALTSMEEYMELLNTSLPEVKVKATSETFLKCATPFPIILWHPYARHHYFCVLTDKEQKKWLAVFQDCIRHSNNGLSEESRVQTPAFTDTVRLYRQAEEHYGTWDMMCGSPPQILSNLVMETLHPKLRKLIGPHLKGKLQQRQRSWMLISHAAYRQVLEQTEAQYEALVQVWEAKRPPMEATLRTDMDQMITSKEHVSGKMRALVLPKAEQLLQSNVRPYVSSILEALMEPTSRGFAEVRNIFFQELVEVSKNTLNDGGKKNLGEHMEKMSMLAFHPVKMQSCYDDMEKLSLEGLQQRFEVPSSSVFIQRGQILMREQMDNSVYTFEQLLHQSLGGPGGGDLSKTIQCCQDRVLKKYDYDSSTVRKKFFREALLQIIVPYMLKHLSPSCKPELPRFQELIFEDFSRFILVENVFEELVLQSVTKDIMTAVKEAAVQRKHNLYRDSIVLKDSDPNLHLLEDNSSVDWASQYAGEDKGTGGGGPGRKGRKQVVSMIQLEPGLLPYESCLEVPGVEGIPEEANENGEGEGQGKGPASPDSVHEIRDLINPVLEMTVPFSQEDPAILTNGVGMPALEDGDEVMVVSSVVEEVPSPSPREKGPLQDVSRPSTESPDQEALKAAQERENEAAIKNAIQEIDMAVQEDVEQMFECALDSDTELAQASANSSPHCHDDSGFQSPSNEALEEGEVQPITKSVREVNPTADPGEVVVTLDQGDTVPHSNSETEEEVTEMYTQYKSHAVGH